MNLLKLGLMGAAVVYGQDQVPESSSWSSWKAERFAEKCDPKTYYEARLPSLIKEVDSFIESHRAKRADIKAETEARKARAEDLAEAMAMAIARREAYYKAIAEAMAMAETKTGMSCNTMIFIMPSVFLGYTWLRAKQHADAQERADAQRLAVAQDAVNEANQRLAIIENQIEYIANEIMMNDPPPYAAEVAPPLYRP